MTNTGKFNADQEDRFLDICEWFDRHGYIVTGEPIEGYEQVFLDTLEAAVIKTDDNLRFVNSRYNTRGASKRAIELLVRSTPHLAQGLVRAKAA
jgi:hypothetical protein